ncbi:hypothetical protein A9Q96_08280 [Rhodobacterales bacterium 52_120_T64]|nr:hypothetical protein A9Q96_08280 [Rhodobacterales bacterium 52_120_T64]
MVVDLVEAQVPYSFKKRGYFYFIRHVPSDLVHHYASKKISYSLRTKSPRLATTRSLIAAVQLDEYWDKLRGGSEQIPQQHFAATDPIHSIRVRRSAVDVGPLMSDTIKLYLRRKGNNRPKTFETSLNRACKYLYETCGDKHLGDYIKKDATTFRDALFERGLNGGSVGRIFGTIKSIFTFAINESGLTINTPFINVYFDKKVGVQLRKPISIDDIKVIQRACVDRDDEMRWLVGLVSDTGLRLAEGAGLLIDDIHLDVAGLSYIEIKPHPWRRLKTESSARIVPLVGVSLWAAQRIIEENDNGFAFPRYNQDEATSANSASAALNKWIKATASDSCTMHSFRHSMRDRPRAVECPTELVDQIGGWSKSGNIGQSYGSGYSLEMMHKWLAKTIIE